MSDEVLQRGRVILTHGRCLHALAAAQSLGRRGVEVIGCDEVPLTALSFSRHVRETFTHAPAHDEPAFIASLERAIERYRPEAGRPYVLMPTHRETVALARHRDKLAELITLAAPPIEAIDAVSPKDRLVATARRLHVPTPATWLVGSDDEERRVAAEVDAYPVLVKPADAAGGRGIRRAEDAASLRAVLGEARAGGGEVLLVQAVVGGTDYCVTGLFDRGRAVASMAYHNLRTFPNEGGFGVVRETVDAEPCRAVAERMMAALGWHGVAQVDFRWAGSGDDPPRLIEVNPRFWGGLFHSVESGVDYPWMLYQLAAQGRVEDAPMPRIGTRSKVPLLVMMSALDEVTEDDGRMAQLRETGPRALASLRSGRVWAALSTVGGAVADVLDVGDRVRALRRAMASSEGAVPEALSSDDPAVSLGVLYVLASLVKSGELPEEFKRGS